jgi:uncharacterized protein YoxC
MPEQGSERVSLGCGTLILIALIVLIFSGSSGIKEVERKIETLTKEVHVLQEKVDALAERLENNELPDSDGEE